MHTTTDAPPILEGIHHLRAAGVSLVIDACGPSLPRVVYWGADLGELDPSVLEGLVVASVPPVAPNSMDKPVPIALLPEHALGWPGLPGISGHRQGRDWS